LLLGRRFGILGARVFGCDERAQVLRARLIDQGKAVRYRVSTHAEEEIERRAISLALVEAVLEKPDQVVPEPGVLNAYQSQFDIGGMMFLPPVIVDDSADPAIVVTA